MYVSSKDSNHPFEPNGLTKGKWYFIEVEQKFSQMEYHYNIRINGETVRDMINTNPQEFIEMKVYAAKPWDNSAEQEWFYSLNLLSTKSFLLKSNDLKNH